MSPDTARALAAINREFYRRNAEAFSDTRDHPWPGWSPILARCAGRSLRVLDVGCGNGRFALALLEAGGKLAHYVGVDHSEPLRAEAKRRLADRGIGRIEFSAFDLVEDDLDSLPRGPFDLIALFGIFHHIPGAERRLELLRALEGRLSGKGCLALAVWDFAERARFAERILPWSESAQHGLASFDPSELETGDHLLRWGEDQCRYCHQVSGAEREAWLSKLTSRLALRYRADGKEGDLNEYFLLEAPEWERAAN